MSAGPLLCLAYYYNEALQKRTHHKDKQMRGCHNYLCFSLNLGSWLLLNMLLVDFAAHIFQSYIEEEKEEGNALVAKQNEVPVLCVYEPSHLSACFAEEEAQANAPQTALVMQNQNNFGLSNAFQSSELFGEHSQQGEININLKEYYGEKGYNLGKLGQIGRCVVDGGF